MKSTCSIEEGAYQSFGGGRDPSNGPAVDHGFTPSCLPTDLLDAARWRGNQRCKRKGNKTYFFFHVRECCR